MSPERTAPRNTIFLDEQRNPSAARVFLAAWLTLGAALLWWRSDTPGLVSWTSVAIGLLSWAAGPRIAQYLAPQIGAAAKAVSDAVSAKIGGTTDVVTTVTTEAPAAVTQPPKRRTMLAAAMSTGMAKAVPPQDEGDGA